MLARKILWARSSIYLKAHYRPEVSADPDCISKVKPLLSIPRICPAATPTQSHRHIKGNLNQGHWKPQISYSTLEWWLQYIVSRNADDDDDSSSSLPVPASLLPYSAQILGRGKINRRRPKHTSPPWLMISTAVMMTMSMMMMLMKVMMMMMVIMMSVMVMMIVMKFHSCSARPFFWQ